MTLAIKQLIEKYGELALLVAGILVLCWAAVKIARVYDEQKRMSKEQEKMSEKQEKMSKEIDKELSVEIARISERQKGMSEEIKRIWGKLTDMGKKLDQILQFQNPQSATQGKSPVTLTEIGRKISANLGAPAILEQLKGQLKEMVFADGKPSNAYDLQEKAFNVAKQDLPDILTPQQLDAAKSAAYEHNSLLSEIMMVFGVLLRDMLMKEMEKEEFSKSEASQPKPNTPDSARL